MVYKRVGVGPRRWASLYNHLLSTPPPPGAVSLPPFLLANHQVELHIRISRLDLIRLHAAQTVEEVLSNLPLHSVFPATQCISRYRSWTSSGKSKIPECISKWPFHLVSSFEETENSFSEEGGELMAIHSKEIIDSTVVNTVLNTRKIGEEQLNTFIKRKTRWTKQAHYKKS